MPDATDLAITVTSDDPKKKDEKKDEKKDAKKTASKPNGDVKEGEAEELVSSPILCAKSSS
jgi:hypothetical protein